MDREEMHAQPQDQEVVNFTPLSPSRKEAVSEVLALLETFIARFPKGSYPIGSHVLSMDLYAAFENFVGVDLPAGLEREFGKRINQACIDGRLPFRRALKTKARLAAYVRVDPHHRSGSPLFGSLCA